MLRLCIQQSTIPRLCKQAAVVEQFLVEVLLVEVVAPSVPPGPVAFVDQVAPVAAVLNALPAAATVAHAAWQSVAAWDAAALAASETQLVAAVASHTAAAADFASSAREKDSKKCSVKS